MARIEDLKEKFNNFWKPITGCEDSFSKLSSTELLKLKNVLSDINNLITITVTKNFLKELRRTGFLSNDNYNEVWTAVNATKANANGFDVKWTKSEHPFVAEVKGNIPVGKTTFGAAQKNSILRDIEHLVNGKPSEKELNTKAKLSKYVKFFVMLDSGLQQEAMKKIIETCNNNGIKIIDYANTDKINLSTDNTVYLVYVAIECKKGLN